MMEVKTNVSFNGPCLTLLHWMACRVDWNSGKVDLDTLMASYLNTGFQATSVGRAIEEINRMRK
jgi:deoxyhypusine synthase